MLSLRQIHSTKNNCLMIQFLNIRILNARQTARAEQATSLFTITAQAGSLCYFYT